MMVNCRCRYLTTYLKLSEYLKLFFKSLSGLDLESTSVQMVELRKSSTDLSGIPSSFAPMPETSAASSRRSSRALETTPPTSLLLADASSGLHPFCPPTSQLEQVKGVKKVRKLKKKRMLRQAQGVSPPADDSDSDSEGESVASRTLMRKLRPRRRASGSLVSTSTPPSTDKPQEEEEAVMDNNNGREDSGVKMEAAKGLATARTSPPPALSPLSHPPIELKLRDSDSSELEMVVLNQAAASEVISIDMSDREDVKMEEEASAAAVDSKSASLANMTAPVSAVPEGHMKEEPPKVACDEVTSTSEMPKADVAIKTDE